MQIVTTLANWNFWKYFQFIELICCIEKILCYNVITSIYQTIKIEKFFAGNFTKSVARKVENCYTINVKIKEQKR